MRVVFDPRAVEDLDNIFQYIAADSPSHAKGIVDRILSSIARLGEFPEMARAGQAEGPRELVIPRLPYIAIYKVDSVMDVLTIIAVFHGAQKRAEQV